MKHILFLTLFFGLAVDASGASSYRHLTPSEVTKLKQAVEDEVYDYGYYDKFYQIGENIGNPQHWMARIDIYINPLYNSTDDYGEVIYKLMPYGQIYRLFYIDANGQLKLDGDPQNHFPITQPSHQTVFMDEADVCRRERSWMRTFFVVDTAPTTAMITSSAQRQKVRTGFSDWEYEHPEQNGLKK
jgi:hypothetical protein